MATPPLLVVALLFRSKAGFGSLPHVIDSVSTFLDSSVQLPLSKASKFGSLALLNRIWHCRVDLEADANAPWSMRSLLRCEVHYERFQFTGALIEAVKRRDMAMIRWLFEHFTEFWVTESIVEAAVSVGDVDVLRYFAENDESAAEVSDRRRSGDGVMPLRLVCWGYQDMAKAAEAGHVDVVRWLRDKEVENERNAVEAMGAAVANGDLELVELMEEITGVQPVLHYFTAAAHGHIALLQRMAEDFVISAKMTLGTLVTTAEKGDLETVRWLIERDWNDEDLDSDDGMDDWEDDDYGYGYGWGARRQESTRPTHVTNVGGEASLAIHAAAINGHLEVAKYIRARIDAPLDRDDEKKEEDRLERNFKG